MRVAGMKQKYWLMCRFNYSREVNRNRREVISVQVFTIVAKLRIMRIFKQGVPRNTCYPLCRGRPDKNQLR
jgi:hypothetical protein